MKHASLGMLLLALASGSAAAADLAECAAIKDEAVRLFCYDRVAGRADAGTSAPPATTAPAATAPAPAAATSAPAAAAAVAPAAPAAEALPKRIESRLVGTFSGWHPGTRFELENGQVWEVISLSTFNGRGEAPKVVIERDFLGQNHFAVEGVKPRPIVRRADSN